MANNDYIDQLVSLVSSGNYIAVAVLVVGLLQVWLSKASAFPMTIPAKWLPVATAATGQLYAVLLVVAAHQPLASAIVHGIIASLLALLTSHAIWSDAGPGWVQWLAILLRDTGDKPQPQKYEIKQHFGSGFSNEPPKAS